MVELENFPELHLEADRGGPVKKTTLEKAKNVLKYVDDTNIPAVVVPVAELSTAILKERLRSEFALADRHITAEINALRVRVDAVETESIARMELLRSELIGWRANVEELVRTTAQQTTRKIESVMTQAESVAKASRWTDRFQFADWEREFGKGLMAVIKNGASESELNRILDTILPVSLLADPVGGVLQEKLQEVITFLLESLWELMAGSFVFTPEAITAAIELIQDIFKNLLKGSTLFWDTVLTDLIKKPPTTASASGLHPE